MNILIKLMSIISLVIAPTLAQINGTGRSENTTQKPTAIIEQTIVQKAPVVSENTIVLKP
jgi:K(+)-stimulated pyrophosphate-energized sodium pump